MEDRFFGTDSTNGLYFPDLVKVAESYGIKAIRIEKNDELDNKIKEAIDSDEPVLCDVICDEWQYLIPRISSEKMPDGTLKAHDYSDMFPFLPRDEYEGIWQMNSVINLKFYEYIQRFKGFCFFY